MLKGILSGVLYRDHSWTGPFLGGCIDCALVTTAALGLFAIFGG